MRPRHCERLKREAERRRGRRTAQPSELNHIARTRTNHSANQSKQMKDINTMSRQWKSAASLPVLSLPSSIQLTSDTTPAQRNEHTQGTRTTQAVVSLAHAAKLDGLLTLGPNRDDGLALGVGLAARSTHVSAIPQFGAEQDTTGQSTRLKRATKPPDLPFVERHAVVGAQQVAHQVDSLRAQCANDQAERRRHRKLEMRSHLVESDGGQRVVAAVDVAHRKDVLCATGTTAQNADCAMTRWRGQRQAIPPCARRLA